VPSLFERQVRHGKVVIACVDGRQQTSVLLLPGFGPKMGGVITFWALCPPGGAAWQAQHFAGIVACCTSQKVTVPVFPVTSAAAHECEDGWPQLAGTWHLKIRSALESWALTAGKPKVEKGAVTIHFRCGDLLDCSVGSMEGGRLEGWGF
jgi:hypothetical protein